MIIYNNSDFLTSTSPIEITIDGEIVATLKRHQYIEREIDLGYHFLKLKHNEMIINTRYINEYKVLIISESKAIEVCTGLVSTKYRIHNDLPANFNKKFSIYGDRINSAKMSILICFAIIAVCLILMHVLPILITWHRSRSDNSMEISKNEYIETQLGKQISEISWEDTWKTFVENDKLSLDEKNKRWKNIYGKRVQGKGYFDSRSISNDGEATSIFVRLIIRSKLADNSNIRVQVNMIERENEKALRLKNGDIVEFKGNLYSWSSNEEESWLMLSMGEITTNENELSK